jgi:anti-sigma factor RsiW
MVEKQEQGIVPCSQPELSDLFFLYVNGDLPLDEQARIEEHLADCSDCQENMRFFLDLQKVGRERYGKK